MHGQDDLMNLMNWMCWLTGVIMAGWLDDWMNWVTLFGSMFEHLAAHTCPGHMSFTWSSMHMHTYIPPPLEVVPNKLPLSLRSPGRPIRRVWKTSWRKSFSPNIQNAHRELQTMHRCWTWPSGFLLYVLLSLWVCVLQNTKQENQNTTGWSRDGSYCQNKHIAGQSTEVGDFGSSWYEYYSKCKYA